MAGLLCKEKGMFQHLVLTSLCIPYIALLRQEEGGAGVR